MLRQAIEKIENEMHKNQGVPYVQLVGQFMIDYLNANNDHAEKILAEGKSILGSLKSMQSVAKDHRIGETAILTPEQGFNAVLSYYGIEESAVITPVQVAPAKKKRVDISIEELL